MLMAGYDREAGKGEQVLEVAVLFDEDDVVRGMQAGGEEFGGFSACCGVIENSVRFVDMCRDVFVSEA